MFFKSRLLHPLTRVYHAPLKIKKTVSHFSFHRNERTWYFKNKNFHRRIYSIHHENWLVNLIQKKFTQAKKKILNAHCNLQNQFQASHLDQNCTYICLSPTVQTWTSERHYYLPSPYTSSLFFLFFLWIFNNTDRLSTYSRGILIDYPNILEEFW